MPWRAEDGKIYSGRYESWIDKQIREAEARGEFDDLPGKGKPLADASRPDDPDWWIKQKVAQEQLDLTASLPLPLQLRKESEQLPDRILEERTEDAARDLVEDYNERVRQSWRESSDGPSIYARLADADELVAHWRRANCADEEAGQQVCSDTETDPPRTDRLFYRALGRMRRRPPLMG